MNHAATYARLKTKVERLRNEDEACRLFGAEKHRYRFNDALSEAEVSAVEAKLGTRLPSTYRQFLTELGNGGAGPHYGLQTVQASILEGQGWEFNAHPADCEIPDWLPTREVDGRSGFDPSGVLEFSELGCGHFAYLMLRGPRRGLVWETDYVDFDPEFPETGPETEFLDWYEQYLDKQIAYVATPEGKERISVPASRRGKRLLHRLFG